MTGFLLRVVVNTLAIWLAGSLLPGVMVSSAWSALWAGLALGAINAIVRPVLVILTFPITLVTLGLFLLVLNALCFWFAAWIIDGFHVTGFGPAFLGALMVSIVSWVVSVFVSDSGRIILRRRRA